MRIITPIFINSKVGEYPQEFLHEVYKIVHAMGVTSREKDKLSSYHFEDVAQACNTKLKYNGPVESGPIEWEEFKDAFMGKYIAHSMRKVKVKELINLMQ